jgi:hypothetical protein
MTMIDYNDDDNFLWLREMMMMMMIITISIV